MYEVWQQTRVKGEITALFSKLAPMVAEDFAVFQREVYGKHMDSSRGTLDIVFYMAYYPLSREESRYTEMLGDPLTVPVMRAIIESHASWFLQSLHVPTYTRDLSNVAANRMRSAQFVFWHEFVVLCDDVVAWKQRDGDIAFLATGPIEYAPAQNDLCRRFLDVGYVSWVKRILNARIETSVRVWKGKGVRSSANFYDPVSHGFRSSTLDYSGSST